MATTSDRTSWQVNPGERDEGYLTEAVEHYTSMPPSITYLGVAFACIGVSALLHMNGRKHDALFVGQWVSPFLIMGLYNKLVKLEGSDSSGPHR